MFNKINITSIVHNHLMTLVNNNTKKETLDDWVTFLILPIIIAWALVGYEIFLDNSAIGIVITALSILVGLLFNVIVLIFDIINRDATKEIKNQLLREILSNISYCILVCIITMMVCCATFSKNRIVIVFSNVIVYLLILNFLATVLMILKRIYKLFQGEIDETEDKAKEKINEL